MIPTSRRRFLQGAAGGGAAVAVGALGVPALKGEARADGLVNWKGIRQAGIVTPRTDYGFVAAYDVVDDDLPGLLRDLTGRIEELTQGWPDRLDPIANASLPPSDTGELGYDKRDDGRLTITVGLGASLFDHRFNLRGRRPAALKRMPSFPGDNLDSDRCHGDLLLIAQSDHAMITQHAVRDVMRRTKGRLQGRWAQACFQRHTAARAGKGPNVAPAIGLLGFADGSQNIATDTEERIFTPGGGSYVAVRLIRLKIERWDRLSRTAQEDSIGRRKLDGTPLEGGRAGLAQARQGDPGRRARTPRQPPDRRRQRAAPLPAPRLRLQQQLRRVWPARLGLGLPRLQPRRGGAVRGDQAPNPRTGSGRVHGGGRRRVLLLPAGGP